MNEFGKGKKNGRLPKVKEKFRFIYALLCFPLHAAVSIGAQTVCLALSTKNNIPFNL
jgi:hypothetical protein